MMTRKSFLAATVALPSATGALGAVPTLNERRVFGVGEPPRYADLATRLADANVVFVGEQHDDPETHVAELALLQAVHRKQGSRLVLSMEMFERDGQAALNDYLSGKKSEAELGKAVKLWPNYATDYRPLVEYAKANRIPVYAANAPAALVRRVGQEGLSVLDKLGPQERAFVASYVQAPENDEYARRFAAIISDGHGDGSQMPPATVRRFYEAQCTRDDTMAETIVRALNADRVVLHINGAFHSDAGLGTVARVLWRKPLGTVVRVVKIVAANKPEPDKLRGEADILVFVPEKPTAKKS